MTSSWLSLMTKWRKEVMAWIPKEFQESRPLERVMTKANRWDAIERCELAERSTYLVSVDAKPLECFIDCEHIDGPIRSEGNMFVECHSMTVSSSFFRAL